MSDRWTPPSWDRVPINIHPDAREALRKLLMTPEFQGVGYSEFIMNAVQEAKRSKEDSNAGGK